MRAQKNSNQMYNAYYGILSRWQANCISVSEYHEGKTVIIEDYVTTLDCTRIGFRSFKYVPAL